MNLWDFLLPLFSERPCKHICKLFFFHVLCEKEKDVSECVSVYVGFAIINTWWVQYVWDACSQPESRKTLGERKTSSATWDPGSDEILRMCTATHTHTHCILTLFCVAARHQYSVKNQYFKRTYKLYYPYYCWLEIPLTLSTIKEQQPLPVFHWKELFLYVREMTVSNPLSCPPNNCPWAHIIWSKHSTTYWVLKHVFETCCCPHIQNMHIFTKICEVDEVQHESCYLCLVVLKCICHKRISKSSNLKSPSCFRFLQAT